MNKYKVVGLMSGTSMDGVDLAYCELTEENGKWNFQLLNSETFQYEEIWRLRLSKLNRQDAQTFWKTHVFYGKFLGKLVKTFIKKHTLNPDLVSSHGHTVFHDPEKGYTAQIGDGAAIYAECGVPVACDFRSLDVALGGQGAPLVALGDKLLFSEYNYCLNLGGIANISDAEKSIAFDICACNILLNRIARNKGLLYDKNGEIARSGKVNEEMLYELNSVDFYKKKAPKSLGREWINTEFWHHTKNFDLSNEDKICTLVEHIAIQISKALYNMVDGDEELLQNKKVLVTGGGALNTFLMERIKAETSAQIVIPDENTINFKEALVFAFLGALRYAGEKNTLASVTGARADSCGGALYGA